MKDFKGTPGPWSQGHLLSTITTKKWDKEQIKRMQAAESLLVVANFFEEDQGRSRQRVVICSNPADAKLIAASKDMAEALQELIQDCKQKGFPMRCSSIISAKAALSKALD